MTIVLRAARALAGLALALCLVAAAGAAALTWRLAQGPLDVTGLATRIAHLYAPELAWDRVTLQRDGFDGGPSTLHLVIGGLAVGDGAITARQAAFALSFTRLLEARIEPTDIVVDGLRLQATRRADGAVVLDGVPSGDETDPAHLVAALQHVGLHDATITLRDAETGRSLQAGGVTIDLQRRPGGAIAGHAQASLAIDGVTVTASLTAERDGRSVTRVQAEVSPVSPAALARVAPKLASLAMLDAPVTIHGTAEIGPDLSLLHAVVQVEAGAGTVLVPAKGGGTAPAHFTAASLEAEGDLSALTLHTLRVVLTPPSGAEPTTLTLSGDGSRSRRHVAIHLAAALDHVALADLPALWPPKTGGGARPWLTENVTGGMVHDGHFKLTLEGSDFDDIDVTQASGGLTGDDVTLWWLRPVPPVEHAQAILTLENPDALLITFTGARQGRIAEKSGSIHITGMMTPHQFGLVTTDLAGPVADVIKLLSLPRMNLLSSHPLPLGNPSGDVAAHLSVHIPLEQHVEFDDVGIHVTGQLSNLHVGGLAAGKDLDQGAITMDVTNDGLSATGTALLAKMPSRLQADMDFRNGPPTQVTQHVAVTVQATEQQLKAAGLDTFKMLGGGVSVTIDYAERRDAAATVQLNGDVRETTFATPFGWSKTAGTIGSLTARAELLHGRLVGVDQLRAEAPGLSIAGHSDIVDGRQTALHIDRLVVGRTSATGTIRFPPGVDDPLGITLSGPRLDLTDLLDAKPGSSPPDTPPKAPSEEGGQRFAVDLRFGQVIVKKGAVGPVALTAEGTVGRLARAQLRVAGPDSVQASLTQAGTGRRVSVTAADLGSILRALDVTDAVANGRLTLSGQFDDAAPGSPFTGTADLVDFRVQGATMFGKVLQGLTLYGLVDALRGPGLYFSRLASPFRLVGKRLELIGARAFSSSLGLTAKGQVDFGAGTLAVDGTIVPAYALNALPGAIPLIGRLFSPERGGGVFAATYSLDGPLADPKVAVNPLAALTPGFLRGVFGMLP